MKVSRKRIDPQTQQSANVEKLLTIDIKAGWKAGTKINFSGEGDESLNKSNQDLQFILVEKANSNYTRQDSNLIMILDIDLKEALTGFTKIIQTLDGRKLKIGGSAGNETTSPKQEVVVRGEGMPFSKPSVAGQKGDLIVRFNILFPSQLSAQQKEELKRI